MEVELARGARDCGAEGMTVQKMWPGVCGVIYYVVHILIYLVNIQQIVRQTAKQRITETEGEL